MVVGKKVITTATIIIITIIGANTLNVGNAAEGTDFISSVIYHK